MKKLYITTLMIAGLFMVTATTQNVSSETSMSQAIVSSMLADVLCEDGASCEDILEDMAFEEETVYDLELNRLGSVIDFAVEDTFGYAIVSNGDTGRNQPLSIEELTLDRESPYENEHMKNMYLSYGRYYEYENGTVYHSNGTVDYAYLYESFKDNATLAGGTVSETYTSTIDADHVVSTETTTAFGFPILDANLISFPSEINNCGPTAGVSLALFFAHYHEELLEDYDNIPSVVENNQYRDYKEHDFSRRHERDDLRELHGEIGDHMHYSGDEIYHANFGIGLKDYFEAYDLDLEFDNIRSYAGMPIRPPSTDALYDYWDDYKAAINQNRPVVMHLGLAWYADDYSMIKDVEEDISQRSDTIEFTYSMFDKGENIEHTVVGYGYTTYNYYIDTGGYFPEPMDEPSYLTHQSGPHYDLMYVGSDDFAIVSNGWGATSYINILDDGIGKIFGVYVD